MPHAGDMKMSFALTNEILFPQIRVPALEDNPQKSHLIVFAKSWHTVDFTCRFSIDNLADLPRIKKVDAFDNNKITAGQGSNRTLSRISSNLAWNAGHFAGRGEHAAGLFPAIERTRRPRLRSVRQERRS